MLSICGNSFQTVGKACQVKLVERIPREHKSVKAKGGYFEESQVLNKSKYILYFFGYYMNPYSGENKYLITSKIGSVSYLQSM